MNFASDNGAGVAPQILDAIVASSRVNAPAYGADEYTARAQELLSEVFETKVAAFLVATGTAANALALSALANPWDAIFCHEEAHIHDDECGAPELFTAGAKLVGIAGEGGKITPEGLRETLERFPRGLVKSAQPGALSLSQATEAGTIYGVSEVSELSSIAHRNGISVHMDGARFRQRAHFRQGDARRHDLARRGRHSDAWRDEERRAGLRSRRVFRFRARGEFRLSAEAGWSDLIQGALPWRANGGLPRGWTLVAAGRTSKRLGASACSRPCGDAGRAPRMAGGGQRSLCRCAKSNGRAMARGRSCVPRLEHPIACGGARPSKGRSVGQVGRLLRNRIK